MSKGRDGVSQKSRESAPNLVFLFVIADATRKNKEMRVCADMSARAPRGQRCQIPFGLELQAAVSHLTMVLRSDSGSLKKISSLIQLLNHLSSPLYHLVFIIF